MLHRMDFRRFFRRSDVGEDAGARIVRGIFRAMQVDATWGVQTHRGFTWWAYRLAQRVWADAVVQSDDLRVCLVHLETDLLRGSLDDPAIHEFLARWMPQATTSGLYWDARESLFRLASAAVVHDENEPWMQPLLAWAAPLQVNEAESLAHAGEHLQGRLATSAHPTSGRRPTPDDMLNLAQATMIPLGQHPSRWAVPQELLTVQAFLEQTSLLATGSAQGISAEFAFGPRPGAAILGGTSALLRVLPDEQHPWLGRGLLLRLSLPVYAGGRQPLMLPLRLNSLERTELHCGYQLGSWGLVTHEDQLFGHRGTELLAYTSFLPSALYQPGLLLAFVISLGARARWADRVFRTGAALRGVEWSWAG